MYCVSLEGSLMTATRRIVARAFCVSDSDKPFMRQASTTASDACVSRSAAPELTTCHSRDSNCSWVRSPSCLKPVQERRGNGGRVAQGESGCESEDARDS